MKADAYRVLERAVEESLRAYLLNRINDDIKRVRWTYEFNGVAQEKSERWIIDQVVDEAVDAVMTEVTCWFAFDDPESPTVQDRPTDEANKERERILDLFRRVRDEDPAAYAAATWAIFTIHEDEEE